MVQRQQEKHTMQQESANQQLQTEVMGQESSLQPYIRPVYPSWPVSKPGPRTTPPPPGMKSVNAQRAEQVAEVGYNQETGEPGVQSPFRSLPDENITESPSFDQPTTAQEALQRRKKRL
ncbi:MAG: hypothetical protein J2P37_15815 [Ktedonobacteraceae bacterium]|nr:hypothetical protein [Ktedonobacteraceae bacterium]MBO0792433.1 hypothetical protein [Ktedonobacteraceae bacterium]